MLNCTDLECILHHHHYYHHGGQFHHYLQDDRAHHEHQPHDTVMSGDFSSDIAAGINNGTDWPDSDANEAALGTHIDDPNGSLYMLCGVLIAMLLVGVIIILLAVTIRPLRGRRIFHLRPNIKLRGCCSCIVVSRPLSRYVLRRRRKSLRLNKLRKREDNLHTTSPTVTTNHNNNVIQQQQQQQQHNNTHSNNNGEVVVNCERESTESLPPPFLWTNSHCSTTASSQNNLYNTDEDNLVHLPCEEPRECKGFRKNLSGKWRRLVKKKPPQEVYTIPAEIREQLKTIYVY